MTEITKTRWRQPNFNKRIVWMSFALLIIITYFWGLNLPLLGPDEPRYAQVAREMFLRGDWITPKLGGFDWFEKPALLYWLQIIAYKIFGVSEFAARFGSALFGLGTIICLWILGRNWAAINGQWSVEKENSAFRISHSAFANWLALISASSMGLIVFAHAASFDIILTLPITAALIGFFLFDQSKEKSNSVNYLLLTTFYFFTGVALIAKGLVGIIFPFAIVAFYYFLSWKLPSKTFLGSLLWGTIVCLLVAAVWYVPVYHANGWKFVDEFIIQHHFQRFTSDKYQHEQPFWFFFLVLPLMVLPWLPFFLVSLWQFIKIFFQQRFSRKNENSSDQQLPVTNHQLQIFAFAWMLVPLVFFSLSGSKLPGYVLPSLPAALILTADYVYRFVQNKPIWRRNLRLATASFFVLIIISLLFFTARFTDSDTVKNLIASADAKGYQDSKILNLYVISYNAEFYGAGRLLRNSDGTQKRFDGPEEIYNEVKEENEPVLVLTSLDGVKYLTESSLLKSDVLGDNKDLAIVAVEKREP